MSDSDNRFESLYVEAAKLGTAQSEAVKNAGLATARAKERKAAENERITELDREASGFRSPQFAGLASVANIFGDNFQDASVDGADKAAKGMARAFMETFTGRTEKSDKGGASSAMANLVSLGRKADTVLRSLQGRLDHWNRVYDSASESESPAEAAEQREQANRYLKLADSASPAQVDAKTGKITKPAKPAKYAGRPAVSLHGIDIPAGKGATRAGQVNQIVLAYMQHGDDVLRPDVLDAFLDNGGKVEKPQEGAESAAGRAMAAITDLLEKHGGKESADAAYFLGILPVLDRISTQGLAAARPAMPTHGAIPAAHPSAHTPLAEDKPEASAVLALPEADAEEGAESTAETAPIDLLSGDGTIPAAPITSKRGPGANRRNGRAAGIN